MSTISKIKVGGTIYDIAYPVGSIYLSVNSTSPAELFGGTWEQIKDTFLLACGDTYTAGSTGGEAQHVLTVEEMPSHSHDLAISNGQTAQTYETFVNNPDWSKNYETTSYSIMATGGSKPHNNMPPYLSVYVWKRIA